MLVDIHGVSSFWAHNGSIMGLVRKGSERRIIYLRPRELLSAIGVTEGTLLYKGSTPDGHSYSGTARTFSARCKSYIYSVSGRVSEDDRQIVLKGNAPRLTADCQKYDTRPDTLVFDFLGSADSTNLARVLVEFDAKRVDF